jgi:hypothetical protein
MLALLSEIAPKGEFVCQRMKVDPHSTQAVLNKLRISNVHSSIKMNFFFFFFSSMIIKLKHLREKMMDIGWNHAMICPLPKIECRVIYLIIFLFLLLLVFDQFLFQFD